MTDDRHNAKLAHIYIESKIRIRLSELPQSCVQRLTRETTYRDPLYAMRRRAGISTEGMDSRIKTHAIKDDHLVLWRGSLGRVLRVLKAAGVTPALHDNRLWLPRVPMACAVELRGYQKDPVHVMIRRQQTVGRGPAGSGKTEMLLSVAAHFEQPTLILVWQERQQRVWLSRIPKWFGVEAGGVGGAFKKPMIAPIMVGMIQSVRNRIDQLKWQFGCVICDEVSRFAAPTLREVVNNMPAAVRLGASDDERRRDGREFLLYDTFGPRGWRLGKSVGQCAVDIVTVPTGFGYKEVEDIPENWTSIIEDVTTSERRNRQVIDLAVRDARAGHRVLIWSDRLEHCHLLKAELIARDVTAGLLIGGKEHKPEADSTERGLTSGEVSVGIGTAVAEQSIDIPPLDRGIMTCASADPKLLRFKQMRGRLARPFEGKESRLYYLWDRRVPMLRRRAYHIKRRYHTREVRPTKETTMAEKAAVTLESMKVGCKLMGIKAPRDATAKTLETLIKRELSKDKTYGVYCCGACFRDIKNGMSHCPFCGAKFMPVPDDSEPAAEEPAEEEAQEELEEESAAEEEVAEDEEELTEEEEALEEEEDEAEAEDDDEEPHELRADDDEGEDADADEEEATEDEGEEEAEEEETEDEEAEEEVDEEETAEDEEETEDEEAPPPKKPAPKKGGAVAKIKDAEREEKREQIRSELPYTEKALKAMKPSVLVMIASVLGHKDPVRVLKNAEGCRQYILKAQKSWAQPEPKPIVKKTKPAVKPPAKATSKPAVKAKAKK